MSYHVGEVTERLENEQSFTTSQLIIQPFRCFSYVITHSPTLLSLLLRHRLFTYVIWRAAHIVNKFKMTSTNTNELSVSTNIRHWYLGIFTTLAAPVSALVYEPVADSRSRINSGHLCCSDWINFHWWKLRFWVRNFLRNKHSYMMPGEGSMMVCVYIT